MKKWLLLFLVVGVLAFPWACGNSPTSPVATPTFTPTATNWNNLTSTNTMTQTMTATPTVTATSTPTNQNGTPTVTFSPSATFTPYSYTPTPTTTNTITFTNTIAWTNTLTPTNTPVPTSTPISGSTPAPAFSAQVTTGIQYPNGVAVSGATLYVAEGNPSVGVAKVQVFTISGTALSPVTTWTAFGSTNFVEPYGVAAAGSTIFVLDNGGGSNGTGVLYAFDSAGTTLGSIDNYSSASFSFPEGVAVDSTGTTVYVSDTENNKVDQFTFNGTVFTPQNQWSGGTLNFLEPSGIAVNASGTVYVADSGNEVIQSYSGSWTTFASTNNFTSNISDVYGVGVDSRGYVYACDVANSVVQQFDNNGNYLSYSSGGSGNAVFESPDGVVYTGSYLIVSDYENGAGPAYTGSLEFLSP